MQIKQNQNKQLSLKQCCLLTKTWPYGRGILAILK